MIKDNQNNLWKNILIETTADDGKRLRGIIHYWSKDYTVSLVEPFEAKDDGSHLMYAIPVRYVTNEAPLDGIKDIHLIPRAKEILRSLYEQNKNDHK